MDHHKDISNKINLSSRSLTPPIIIIYTNSGKDKDDDDDNESK